MLAVSSSLRNINQTKDDNKTGDMQINSNFPICPNEFPEFADHENLLESISFDDLFMGIDDGDILPDLEMDSEIFGDFSVSGGEEYPEMNTSGFCAERVEDNIINSDDDDKSKREKALVVLDKSSSNGGCKNGEKGKKSLSKDKNGGCNNPGKRKVKVDWTPELHRRFVQAVEQLGVDKAVPSRILELMGIDCLTRHNIASHLQKYRSHRKHVLAREAEAASWNQRRQMYAASNTPVMGGKNHWIAPTIGFPPMHHQPHFRPLHVWGHPTMDPSLAHTWPKHITHPQPMPPPHVIHPQPMPPPLIPRPLTWAPPHAPAASYWHQRVPIGVTAGTPCFPPPMVTPMRFGASPFPIIPPPQNPMYKMTSGVQSEHRLPVDIHPSKESVDAVIEDVLTKPWLPLPLGLKPPSVDTVVVELHRQGISTVPPT